MISLAVLELAPAIAKKMLRNGYVIIPRDVSWRKSKRLTQMGIGTLYPFDQRWRGRIDLTETGRTILLSLIGEASAR